MNQERISQAELDRVKSILQSKHGVFFFPKRKAVMPVIKRDSVVVIAGEQKIDISMRAAKGIENYLTGLPIGDQFGADHNKRRQWREERRKEFGEAFGIVYEEKNQFRINIMFNAISGISLLDVLARDNKKIEAADNLKRITDEWRLRISGVDSNIGQRISAPYNSMESYGERLKVVHFGEDKCLEALTILSSH